MDIVMSGRLMFAGILIFLSSISAFGAPATPWDAPELWKAPATHPCEDVGADGLKALYYDGMPYKGKPTRVFAWYGVPSGDVKSKYPAMVLVHGGGGTAFEAWVRLWNQRGYAAIAMDNCGCIPKGEYSHWERNASGGPAGWGGFDMIEEPEKDQWTYHAVADVILAHSLLRSFPEVDPERIGITGISWGGYLTCITAGVDERFKFAVLVYGCGFLGDNSAWLGDFEKLGQDKAKRWLGLWDPSVYLPRVSMPMLWVTGTNDFAYPMDSLRKSYRLPKAERSLCVTLRMPHGHGGAGENPKEIHAFADQFCKGGVPLAKVVKQGVDGAAAWVAFESDSPVVKAELNYTKDSGVWKERNWETIPAVIDADVKKATAMLPEGAVVYYFNMTDERGLVSSSEHVETGGDPQP
jgi:dienelactone hydrolase